jgi:hypothetical protein
MAETITVAFFTVLCINAMLFIGQVAITNTSSDAVQFMNCQGNIMGQLEQGNCSTPGSYILDDSDPSGRLSGGGTSVDPDTGFSYTDSYTGLKGFFLNTLGLGYLGIILSAPYNFLKALHLPQVMVFIIGSLWYAFSLMLLIGYLFGRSS